jgi:hypothetical protein
MLAAALVDNNKASEAIYELLLKKEEHLSSEEDLASVIKHLFYGHKLPLPNQKCLLRNVHSANAAHTLLTFFLFIK